MSHEIFFHFPMQGIVFELLIDILWITHKWIANTFWGNYKRVLLKHERKRNGAKRNEKWSEIKRNAAKWSGMKRNEEKYSKMEMNKVKRSEIKRTRVRNEIELWIRCEMEKLLTQERVNWCFELFLESGENFHDSGQKVFFNSVLNKTKWIYDKYIYIICIFKSLLW